MASINFDIMFDDGRVIEHRGAACFMSLQHWKSQAHGMNQEDPKYKGLSEATPEKVRYYYRHADLNSSANRVYLKYVFKKFGKYIVTKNLSELLQNGYVEVYLTAPAPVVMGVLTFLRNPDEFPEAPITFDKLKSRYPFSTTKNTALMFMMADAIQLQPDTEFVKCSDIGSHNSNHVIYTPTNLTDFALQTFMSEKWICDETPAAELMQFNGITQLAFTGRSMYSFDNRTDPRVPKDCKKLIINTLNNHIDELIKPLLQEYA